MSDVVLVLCTAPQDEAGMLAGQLLEENLVACVNEIGPVTSRYRWKGEVTTSREVLLLMKTTRERVAVLRDRIEALHSYEVPEVLEFDVASGLPAYLQWVVESCELQDRS